MIDSILDGSVEGILQFLLTDIVLILPNTDCLRINFDKLRQGILYTPRDGYGTAYRYVVVRQFLLCQRGGRVDRCTCLVCDEIAYIAPSIFANQCRNELFCFIGCRTIADGDQRDAICSDEFFHRPCRCRTCAVTLCHLDHAAVEHISCRVDNGHFTSRAVTGVKSEYRMPCERRLQKELTQIVPKNADCLFFCIGG